MTLAKIISMVDEMKPNQYDSETKTAWMSEVEGMRLNLKDMTTIWMQRKRFWFQIGMRICIGITCMQRSIMPMQSMSDTTIP